MAEANNVFISWSGPRSKSAAEAIKQWLPLVVPTASPWMSAADIDKGTRWREEVAAALDTMKAGIICLTPENLTAEWLLFEAGALSKTRDPRTRVWTYLLAGLKPQHVKDPLAIFQATTAEKEDTRGLIHSVNKNLDATVPESRVNHLFDKLWPDLERELAGIPEPSGAAPPKRPPEEMLAEILELSRASAQSRKSVEVLDPYLPAFAEFMPVFMQFMPLFAEALKAAQKQAGPPNYLPNLPPGAAVRRRFVIKHHDDAQLKSIEGVNAVDNGSGELFVLDETGKVLARFANVEQWWPEPRLIDEVRSWREKENPQP
jgi:hypothetical protein